MRDETIDPRKRLTRLSAILLAALAATLWEAAVNAAEPSRPQRDRLESWVKTLAAPELEGRKGEGGRRAAGMLVEEFRRLKLEPHFGDQYVQVVPAAPPVEVDGRNVAGVLRGSDPVLRDEYVILSAHYDHLGKRGERLYPGADDNASGVAMMLEAARCLTSAAEPPKRSIVFIGFDLEEAGLYGSRYYAANPPVPLEKVSLFITADMIGRSLGGVCDGRVFVMGSEHVPALRPWIAQAAENRHLSVGLLGADLLVLNRSDYGPFRGRKVPFLFFSTGENPTYHTPTDVPETIDYATMTEISRVIYGVVERAADAPNLPKWSDEVDHPVDEARTLRDVLEVLSQRREDLKINAAQVFLINKTRRTLDAVIDRGHYEPAERASVLQAARILIMTAF